MANELIAWAQKESDKEFEMKALQSIGRKKS